MANAIKLLSRGKVLTEAQTDDKQVCLSSSNDDTAQDLTDFKTALALNSADLTFTSYERHAQIPATLRGTPAAQPAEIAVDTLAGLQYSNGGTKYAYAEWEIPEDWDGGNIYFEVDWFPDASALNGTTDTVVWNLAYRSITEGQATNAGSLATDTLTESAAQAQYVTKHSRFTLPYNDADQPLAAGDHIYLRVSRDSGDVYAGTVVVTAFEIVYNSVGFPTN